MLNAHLIKLAAAALLAWPAADAVTAAKLRVVATTPDLAALAREIGGTAVDVTALAKPTEDPHYVDAKPSDVRQWYVDRFLSLRQTAFADPASYFHRYASLSDDEAVERAESIWDSINSPNLEQNILPTRSRATLVLTKGSDHSVQRVRLRKL